MTYKIQLKRVLTEESTCEIIKRKSILNKFEEGGLNMIDLKTQICAIKAAWTCRIITAPYDPLWSYLPKLYLSKFGNEYFIVKSTVTSTKMFHI